MRIASAVVVVVAGWGCTEGSAVVQDTPERFGFGSPATPEQIAAIDIDVNPAGDGLPPGSGTVARGHDVYRAECLACHGPTGVEGPNDRLVGRVEGDAFPFATDPSVRLTIGNYWPYATTVFDYVNRAMPFDHPGSMTADDVYAVTALLLFWNDIIPEDAVMNAETLPQVVMPSRDKFVVDNRTGGTVIR